QFGGFKPSNIINILFYATLAVIGAKTRFWVNERRKSRPVWKSVLFLLLVAPVFLTTMGIIIWALKAFG
ncbi:MAG: hypothetical protein ACPG5W_11450, partial [Flavobacteriales bacterium]